MKRILYNLTARLRCRLIHRSESERYLERYWLGSLLGCTAYLHRFVAEDADEWVHDHPWRWSLAIVLTGHYTEERLRWWSPETGWHSKTRKIGGWRRLNCIGPATFHRITRTRPETWTLFIHGPRIQGKGWGFLEAEHKPTSLGGGLEVFYHQPYNTTRSADWHTDAPLGRDADRAPMET